RNLPPSLGRMADALTWRISWPVLAFTAAIAITCTILVCIWPAQRVGRTDLVHALAGRRRRIAGLWAVDRGLVVAQVALGTVLVWSAALLVVTVKNLTHEQGGYRSRNILL